MYACNEGKMGHTLQQYRQVVGMHSIYLVEFRGYFKGKFFCAMVLLFHLGPLYTNPGCFLPRVESTQRVTLSQSNVYKCSHENSSQAGSAHPCQVTLLETRVDPARRAEISSISPCKQWPI